jgi:small conductance mechanosensitive channel
MFLDKTPLFQIKGKNHMNIDIDKTTQLIGTYALDLVGAIAIFVLGRFAIKLAVAMARRVMTASKVDETLVSFSSNVLYTLGLAFVVIAALGQLGIQTTSLAAIIGAAGLAIGLALQGSLGNLASGVMIIGMRPFKLGDHVETSGKSGVVTAIDIFTTTLRSDDGHLVIIPNGKITADIIVNRTAVAA